MKAKIKAIISESMAIKEKLGRDDLVSSIEKVAKLAISCLKNGGKLILFGNGGSASDSQHIAAELIGRFKQERKALAAIALSDNSSSLTAIANDYDFKQVFSRQIAGLGQSRDLAIAISTSGSSPNVLAGINQAKAMGIKTVALTGASGAQLAKMVDAAICIPSTSTARIQEAHITVGHIICELIESAFISAK